MAASKLRPQSAPAARRPSPQPLETGSIFSQSNGGFSQSNGGRATPIESGTPASSTQLPHDNGLRNQPAVPNPLGYAQMSLGSSHGSRGGPPLACVPMAPMPISLGSSMHSVPLAPVPMSPGSTRGPAMAYQRPAVPTPPTLLTPPTLQTPPVARTPPDTPTRARARPQSASATTGRRPMETNPAWASAMGGRPVSAARSAQSNANEGLSVAGRSLQQIHYEAMRRQTATRDRLREEREDAVEKTMDTASGQAPGQGGSRPASATGRRVRPASAGAATGGRRAPTAESTADPAGLFSNFVASGNWKSATGQVDLQGFPIPPRKAFTAIPGYGGYVPRKTCDSIIGCTFHRGNMLARGALFSNFNFGGQ